MYTTGDKGAINNREEKREEDNGHNGLLFPCAMYIRNLDEITNCIHGQVRGKRTKEPEDCG